MHAGSTRPHSLASHADGSEAQARFRYLLRHTDAHHRSAGPARSPADAAARPATSAVMLRTYAQPATVGQLKPFPRRQARLVFSRRARPTWQADHTGRRLVGSSREVAEQDGHPLRVTLRDSCPASRATRADVLRAALRNGRLPGDHHAGRPEWGNLRAGCVSAPGAWWGSGYGTDIGLAAGHRAERALALGLFTDFPPAYSPCEQDIDHSAVP
jgi:hypothetical protein